VRCEGRSLTFAEVDEAANRIAQVLAGLGVTTATRPEWYSVVNDVALFLGDVVIGRWPCCAGSSAPAFVRVR
jgi:non-ribosomal peptide synthetase component F